MGLVGTATPTVWALSFTNPNGKPDYPQYDVKNGARGWNQDWSDTNFNANGYKSTLIAEMQPDYKVSRCRLTSL